MAGYFDRINIVIDVVTTKATDALKDFQTKVRDAEGFTGKFKAGLSSLKSNGPAFAGALTAVTGVIVGIGRAAFAAGDQFVKLARQSRNLGVATGLTTEQASRLIEVFGDLGGDAGVLESTLSKIPKTLDSGKWEDYGVATKTAGGSLRSTNDILLDGIDALGKIKDPTARAKAGIDLFGKSWGNLAPLIGKSRDELDTMLASVSSGKTITEGETKRAEKLAAAQDNLSDAFETVTLTVGELVASLSPILNGLATATGWVTAAFESLNYEQTSWAQRQEDVKGTIGEQYEAINNQRRAVYALEQALKESKPALVEYGDANKTAAEQEFYAAQQAAELERKLANKRGGVAWAAKEAQGAIEEMMGALTEDQDWIAVQLALGDLQERLAAITKQYEDGEIDQREYWLLTRQEILSTKTDLLGFIDQLDGLDPYLKQKILFEFDRGDANAVIKLIEDFFAGKKIQISTGLTTPVGMPWIPGGTGPKDQPYGGVTINVNGALDPVATADQIERILRDQRYRDGQGGY